MTNEHCHTCGRETATVLIEFRHDLIGRCCSHCRACRKRRPYAKRAEYLESLNPVNAHASEVKHESPSR